MDRLLFSIAVVTALASAQGYSDIPDRIHKDKFKAILEKADKASEELQTERDKRLGIYQSAVAERKELEAKEAEFKKTIAKLNQEVDVLNASIADHKGRIDQWKVNIAKNNDEVSDLSNELPKVAKNILEAKEKKDKQEKILDTSLVRRNEARENRDRAESELNSVEASLARLNKEKNSLSTLINSLDSEITGFDQELKSNSLRIRDVENELPAYIRERNQLAAEIGKLQSGRSNIFKQKAQAEVSYNEALEIHAEQVRVVETSYRKVAELEQRKDDIDQSIADIQASIADFQSKINAARDNIASMERRQATLQDQRREAEDERANRQSQFDRSIEEQARVDRQITTVANELNDLEDEMTKLEGDLEKNSYELVAAQQDLRNYQSDLGKANENLIHLNNRKSTNAQRINQLQKRKRQVEPELRQAKSALSSKNSSAGSLNATIAQIDKELDDIKSRLQAALRNKAEIESAMSQKTAELTTTQAQIRDSQADLQRIQSNIAKTKAAIESNKGSIAILRKDLKGKTAELTKLKTKRDNFKVKKGELEDQITALDPEQEKEKIKLEKELDRILKQLNTVKTEIAALTPKVNTEIPNQIAELRKNGETLRQRLRTAERREVRVTSNIESQQDREREIKAEMDQIAHQQQLNLNRITQIEGRRKAKRQERVGLLKDLNSVLDEIEGLEVAVASLERENKNIPSRIRNLEDIAARISGRITETSRRIQRLDSSITQTNRTITSLNKQKRDLNSQNQYLTNEHQKQQRKYVSLSETRSNLESNRVLLYSEILHFGRIVRNLDSEISLIPAALSSERSQLVSLQNTEQALQSDKSDFLRDRDSVLTTHANEVKNSRQQEEHEKILLANVEEAENTVDRMAAKLRAQDLEIDKVALAHDQIVAKISALNDLKFKLEERSDNIVKTLRPSSVGSLNLANNELVLVRNSIDSNEKLRKTRAETLAQRISVYQNRQSEYLAEQSSFEQRSAEYKKLLELKARHEARIEQLKRHNVTLEQSIKKSEGIIAQNQSGIQQRQTKIAGLESNLKKTIADLDKAKSVESQTNKEYELAQKNSDNAKAEAGQALASYQTVLAQYNKELAAAREVGKIDGTQAGGKEGAEVALALASTYASQHGEVDGKKQGKKLGEERDYKKGYDEGFEDGTTKGSDEGTDAGEQAGTTEGYAQGLKEGRVSGYRSGETTGLKDGQEQGFNEANNSGNEKTGYDAGYSVGQERALKIAVKEETPKAKAEALSEVYAKEPSEKLTIDQSKPEQSSESEEVAFAGHTTVTSVINNELESFTNRETLARVALNGGFGESAAFRSMAMRRSAAPMVSRRSHGAGHFGALAPSRMLNARAVDSGSKKLKDPMPPPTPPSESKYVKLRTDFDHPDFTAGYRETYLPSYATGHQSRYKKEYAKDYINIYDRVHADFVSQALAVIYLESLKKGKEDGLKAGYDKAFAESRREAYASAFEASEKEGFQTGSEEQYPLGYDKGHKEGLKIGQAKGKDTAYNRGFGIGSNAGFDENIAALRVKTFERVKEEALTAVAESYLVKPISASMVKADGISIFGPGDTAFVQLKIRNFGGKAVPSGNLSIQVKDLSGHFEIAETSAPLYALNANAEGVFVKVVEMKVKVGVQAKNAQLGLKLFNNATEIAQYALATEIQDNFEISIAKVYVSPTPGNYWRRHIEIKNLGGHSGQNLNLILKSRDNRIEIKNGQTYRAEAIPVNRVSPGQKVRAEFVVTSNARGPYQNHVLDVELRDRSTNALVFKRAYKAPIEVR